jgi:very-short-patch-repair endonuclease
MYPDLDLEIERMLIPGRRYRTDYLHVDSKTVIEVHGGEYQQFSGHSTTKGRSEDAKKQNALVVLGYKPFVLHTSMVNCVEIKKIGEAIRLWSS